MSRAQRVVADGLRFPEGPSHLGGGAIAVAEMQGESVTRVDPDGRLTVLGDLGGGPNGTALGSDGAVYVANNGGLSAGAKGFWHAPREFDGCVQRVDADGTVTTVGGTLPGPAPHRPNDLCFAPDGTLLVTDSADWEKLQDAGPGRVVAIGPDGEPRVLAELPGLPNGLAFGAGGDVLYLALSMSRKVVAFDWRDGALTNQRTFCKLPGGMPDGLAFDAEGTLWVCGSLGDAIHAYDADGELKETIGLEKRSQPTNCCIAEGNLYVTLSIPGQLVAYDVGVSELSLHQGSISTVATGAR